MPARPAGDGPTASTGESCASPASSVTLVTVSADPILTAIQAGDRAAWGRAYTEHRESMYAAAFRKLHDHQDALDAVQEAMASVMTSGPEKLAEVRGLGAYLARAAANKAIDHIRKNQRARATDPDVLSDLTAEEGDIEELAGDRIGLKIAAGMLAKMPNDVRFAYEQRVLMRRKAKDVAADLDCTPQYIPQLLTKALSIIEEHSPFIEPPTSDPSSPTASSGATKDAT